MFNRLKTKLAISLLLSVISLLLFQCQSNLEEIEEELQIGTMKISKKISSNLSSDISLLKREYDLDITEFSLAVVNAVRTSSNFREILKNEALLMIDGDYDVLLDRILDKKIKQRNGEYFLKKSNSTTVKKFLEDSYLISSKKIFQSGTVP